MLRGGFDTDIAATCRMSPTKVHATDESSRPALRNMVFCFYAAAPAWEVSAAGLDPVDMEPSAKLC